MIDYFLFKCPHFQSTLMSKWHCIFCCLSITLSPINSDIVLSIRYANSFITYLYLRLLPVVIELKHNYSLVVFISLLNSLLHWILISSSGIKVGLINMFSEFNNFGFDIHISLNIVSKFTILHLGLQSIQSYINLIWSNSSFKIFQWLICIWTQVWTIKICSDLQQKHICFFLNIMFDELII